MINKSLSPVTIQSTFSNAAAGSSFSSSTSLDIISLSFLCLPTFIKFDFTKLITSPISSSLYSNLVLRFFLTSYIINSEV